MTATLKERWREGRTTLGGWCMVPGTVALEAIARSDFDFICLDMQHGAIDYPALVPMLQVTGLGGATPVVRVAGNDPVRIGQVLDAGAMGVIVPMVNTPAQAAAAVDACRYAPEGSRSFGPILVGMREGPGYFDAVPERVTLIVMIETAEALENVEAILATPGVDAAFIGPYDLSVSLGMPPGDNDGTPAFDAALERVLAACRGAGVTAGILSNRGLAAKRVAQGFAMVTVATELHVMTAAMQADLEHVRGEIAGHGS